jgi:Zn-dependent peptidase ImmA (M78 family)
MADHLRSGPGDRWLPVTDAATARQKVQRAFAAEFLCPIESLRDYLSDEFLPEAFEDAAEYFGISEMAVKSHLANHHLIPRSLVEAEAMP